MINRNPTNYINKKSCYIIQKYVFNNKIILAKKYNVLLVIVTFVIY